MLRTHTCGELRLHHVHQQITFAGWVQRVRNKGGLIWVDLRDRYGLTQLIFEEGSTDNSLLDKAAQHGREFVVQATGRGLELTAKNDKMQTGELEIQLKELTVINSAKVYTFLI